VRNDIRLVLDDPFNDFTLLELHGLRHSGGEVDVILIGRFLPTNLLNFCWVSHDCFSCVNALAYMLDLYKSTKTPQCKKKVQQQKKTSAAI
jgi:hypothetical protein